MADIKFPPKCEPISRNFDEAFLEDHLTSIFYYFTSFSHDTDYIVEYYKLWAELNEIGKMENSVVVPVLATCTATEILRNWIETFGHVERKYADNFFDLYRNVTKHLKRIDQNSRNYMWKYNLLQVWAEKALFRLDVINRRMNETVVDQLFAKMVQILLELGSRWDNPDKMMEFIRKGLEQMVQSSAKLGRSALKELLMPLLTGNSSMRLSIKGCISHLTVRQCQFLCSLISRKILLNHRCELFDGLELRMAEKLLLIINNFEVFEPLILVATKASLNCFHRDHERVLRILCVLLIRYTGKYQNVPWENIELDTRKKIQLMVSRLKSAMINSYSKFYPGILLAYGTRLLYYAPNIDIKFRYLQIFQYYMKNCRGECRDQLIRIFDSNLN